MPPPGYRHGQICGTTFALVRGFGRRTGHGHAAGNDSAVRNSEDTVRGADVCYYSEARWPLARVPKEDPPVPPDQVVEVLSPSDRFGEVVEKLADYLRAGVACVWILDPEGRNLTISRADAPAPVVLREAERLPAIPELPGFEAAVADFFA